MAKVNIPDDELYAAPGLLISYYDKNGAYTQGRTIVDNDYTTLVENVYTKEVIELEYSATPGRMGHYEITKTDFERVSRTLARLRNIIR